MKEFRSLNSLRVNFWRIKNRVNVSVCYNELYFLDWPVLNEEKKPGVSRVFAFSKER